MKTFNVLIKLKAHEGHRTHLAELTSESLSHLLGSLSDKLAEKFLIIQAYHGRLLADRRITYTVIINTAEIVDVMIDEVTEE